MVNLGDAAVLASNRIGLERRKYRNISLVTDSGHSDFSKISRMVKKFPNDFDIFSWLIWTNPLCTQYRANSFPVAPHDCAISFS